MDDDKVIEPGVEPLEEKIARVMASIETSSGISTPSAASRSETPQPLHDSLANDTIETIGSSDEGAIIEATDRLNDAELSLQFDIGRCEGSPQYRKHEGDGINDYDTTEPAGVVLLDSPQAATSASGAVDFGMALRVEEDETIGTNLDDSDTIQSRKNSEGVAPVFNADDPFGLKNRNQSILNVPSHDETTVDAEGVDLNILIDGSNSKLVAENTVEIIDAPDELPSQNAEATTSSNGVRDTLTSNSDGQVGLETSGNHLDLSQSGVEVDVQNVDSTAGLTDGEPTLIVDERVSEATRALDASRRPSASLDSASAVPVSSEGTTININADANPSEPVLISAASVASLRSLPDLIDPDVGDIPTLVADESSHEERMERYLHLAQSPYSNALCEPTDQSASVFTASPHSITLDEFSSTSSPSPPQRRGSYDKLLAGPLGLDKSNAAAVEGSSTASLSSSQRRPSQNGLSRANSARSVASTSKYESPAREVSATCTEEASPTWSLLRRKQEVQDSSQGPDSSNKDHTVYVGIRVRPFNQSERQASGRTIVSHTGDSVVCVNPNVFDAELDAVAAAAAFTHAPDWAKTFRFDYCFGPESKTSNDSIVSASSDQKIVHQAVGSRIVDAILSGTSASCFTYGRTGTGKSYTLFGKADETSNMDGLSESSGLIPRVLTDIFAGFGKDTSLSDTRITLSFLEIYNEKIRDLLVTASADKAWASDSSDAALGSALKVREHPYLGPYVEGLLKAEVQSAENAIALLCNGSHQRTVGSSLFKPLSSRSHAIVILELSPKEIDINAIATGKVAYPFSSKSNKVDDILVRLHVVDLAGSEREDTENSSDVYSSKPLSGPSVSSSKSSSYTMSPLNSSKRPQTAEEKLELKLIRRSLSTLGYIIRALHKNAPYPTLPYRDSVLTWLLRDALCGKRHVTMLATLSPSHTSYEETLNTLKYAGRLCRHTPVELLPRKIVQSEDKGFIEEFNSVSSWQRVMRNSTDSISRTTTPISTPARSRIVSELTQGSSQKMLHQTLGGGTPGSSAAQKLLQNVVSDPQQRLAKLGMNDVYHRSMIDSYASSENSTLSEQPGSTAASASAMMFQVVDLLDDGTQQSNVDSHNHRELQGQLVELQIELQSARTDRDSMLLELQAARDALNAATSTKVTSTDAMSDLTGRLRYAEDSVEELKSAGSQKDAEIDRLASELESEKNAKRELESSMKAQEDGYVARAEALEREHAALLDEYDKVQLASRITQENAEEATKSLNSLSTPIRKDSLEVSMQCLREENSDLREQNENLIRRNADHEQAMGAVEKKVQELVESQRECEERLAASQKTINAFPKERERYKGLIESMRAANAKLAEKVKAAKESAKECAKEPENDAEDTCTASKVGSQAGTSEGVNATLAALTRENNELKAQLLQKREELLERMKRASDDYLNEMYAASVDDDIDAEDVCGLEEGLKALIAREDILNNTDVRSKKEKDRSKQLTENIQTQLSSIRKTCTDNFNLRQDLDKDKFKIQELEKKIIALQGGTVDERVAAAEQSLADVKDRMVTKENMIEDLKMQIKMMENLPQYDRKTAQEQGLSPRSRLDNASLQQAYENKIKALLKQQDELKDELLAKPSSNMNLMAITDGSNRSNGDGRAQVIVSLGTVGGNPAPSRTPTRTHTQSVSSESGANLPANSATPSPAELQNLLVEQKKATEMSEARAVYWERVAQKVRNLTGEDSTDEVVAALRKENEDLKAMTFDLKSQLEQARQEVDKMKEELKAQGDVKAEFASLWMTVQELNAVDAQKEAALSALVEDRDRLTKEKNEVEVKMAGLADAYTHLQSELMAIDSDLAQAAEDEKISVSAEKPKSLNKQVNGKERIKPANSNGMKHASTGPQMTSHPRGKGSNVAPVAPSLSPLDTRTFSNLLGIPHEKAIAATAHQNARSKSPRPWDNAFSYTMSPRNSTTPPRAPLSAQPRSNGRSVGSAKKELSRGKKSSDVHRNSITSLSSMKTSSSAGSKKTKNLQHMLAPLPVGDDDSIVAEAILQSQIAELSELLPGERLLGERLPGKRLS